MTDEEKALIKEEVKENIRVEIKESVMILLDAALRLLEGDPHQWSIRGCPTCQAVSHIVGRSFGCIKKAERGTVR